MQQKPIEGYINSTQEHTLKDSKMEKKKKNLPNTSLCRVRPSTARFSNTRQTWDEAPSPNSLLGNFVSLS